MHFHQVFFLIFFAYVKSDFPSDDSLDWWQKAIIYQIFTPSFKDSNADGMGDLKGIEEKSEYLKDLGVNAVWLTPIYQSPMVDMGYDVSNFTDINPILGTMDNFISLRDKLHSLDIKVILDFVPNHTSDEHKWFINSVKKIDPYTNFYIWKDPKGWINETTPIPPTNWLGVFEIGTWTYHAVRKQFYLHFFTAKQPDLNYRCNQLVEEMKNALRFWLDLGVDGFRMDAVCHLFENESFPDEVVFRDEPTVNGKPSYHAYDHTYTQYLPETYDMFRQFREILDTYKSKDGKTRVMTIEAYTWPNLTMQFFGNESHPIAQLPSNYYLQFQMEYKNRTALSFRDAIALWLDYLPKGEWTNFSLENHDVHRVSYNFGPVAVDMMNIMLLLLPGTPFVYYGQEIGMNEMQIRWDQTTDVKAFPFGPQLKEKFSRDPLRTPFQWDSSSHAGFSNTTGRTWLPVNPDYFKNNVAIQKSDPKSHLNTFKNLTKLRSNEVFRRGDFKMYIVSERIFAFKRSLQNEIYLILMNLNNVEEFANIESTITDVPQHFKVVLTSENSECEVGHYVNASSGVLKMRPQSAVVLKAI